MPANRQIIIVGSILEIQEISLRENELNNFGFQFGTNSTKYRKKLYLKIQQEPWQAKNNLFCPV